jgi:hypothetical protein
MLCQITELIFESSFEYRTFGVYRIRPMVNRTNQDSHQEVEWPPSLLPQPRCTQIFQDFRIRM